MIHSANLSDRMVYPGDLFRLDATDPDEVWINISPVCQTVPRTKGGDAMDKEVRLHLIKGTRAGEVPLSKKKWEGLESKRKGPNGMVIDTVLEGLPYYFDFDDAQILTWNSVRESWIGRVLPPFVTRLQQKHSAYLQTEGLPKATFDLYREAGAGGDALPPAWLEQLAVGGRLVAPMQDARAGGQVLVVVDRTADGWREQRVGAVHFVPLKSGRE